MRYLICLSLLLLTSCATYLTPQTRCKSERELVCERFGTNCYPVTKTVCITDDPNDYVGGRCYGRGCR